VTSRQFVSELAADGTLTLALRQMPMPEPVAGEVLLRVDAAPVNPADIKLMLAGVTPGALVPEDGALVGSLPSPALAAMAARIGKSLLIGNEGCGTVLSVGPGLGPDDWVGKRVAVAAGAMFADHATASAADCIILPDEVSAEEGAAAWINPLTALAMVETMRREGHKALVLTAAASSLGQMLNRLCLADGIAVVNIVRSPVQAGLLHDTGAAHVCDSSAADFDARLEDALAATGATFAFDATGGGTLAGRILRAMDRAQAHGAIYSRYGSAAHKQLYFFGGLDPRPVEFERNFGMAWGMGGWLLQPRLAGFGPETVQHMKDRVAREIASTFRTEFGLRVPLAGLLDPQALGQIAAMKTGGKALLLPPAG
jgi:NADPH:quinone reductase-like Zn-dependent oxidoreductase